MAQRGEDLIIKGIAEFGEALPRGVWHELRILMLNHGNGVDVVCTPAMLTTHITAFMRNGVVYAVDGDNNVTKLG